MDGTKKGNLPPYPDTLDFIPDIPAKADTFGGTHSRTAKLIADNILANPHLKAVGLLGPWGSGKSTVVELVGVELDNAEGCSCSVFVFDAWKYQSDAPRRAFIEALVGFFAKLQGHTYASWRDKLDRITGRTEVSQTFEVPTVAKATRYALFTIPLTAIGLALVTRCDTIGKGWTWLGTGGVAVVGTLMALSPLLTALVADRFVKPDRAVVPERETPEAEAVKTQSSLMAVLKQEARHTKKRVIKDPVPSTAEFQHLVRAIIDAVIPKQQRKTERLLVVIDNLDRLPDDEAMAVWSTIRSLFLGPDGQRHAGDLDGVTVLVPIAEDVIERKHGKTELPGLAEAFIEKSFDLTVRIPRPLFTDWHSHFRTKLEAMFKSWMSPEAVGTVTTLLDEALTDDKQPVTPRRLNGYVNRMGVLWLQWAKAGVSDSAIAYYVIHQRRIDGNIAGIMDAAPLMDHINPEWRKEVCAMHYGVAPTQGIDVLMKKALPEFIEARDWTQFKAMALNPGFPTVMARLAAGYLATPSVAPLAKALEGMLTLPDGSNPDLDQVWNLLGNAYANGSSDTTITSSPDLAEGLMAHLRVPAVVEVADTYVNLLSVAPNGMYANTNIFGAHQVVKALQTQFIAQDLAIDETTPTIAIPGSAENFMQVVSRLLPRSPILPLFESAADITPLIAGNGGSDSVDMADRRIEVALYSATEVNWPTYIETLGSILRGHTKSPYPTAVYALTALCGRGDPDALALAASYMADDGEARIRLNDALGRADATLFSRLLFAFLALRDGHVPTLSEPVEQWCDDRPQFRSALAEAIDLMTDDNGATLRGLGALEKADPRLAVR
jgi:hypothetical protein